MRRSIAPVALAMLVGAASAARAEDPRTVLEQLEPALAAPEVAANGESSWGGRVLLDPAIFTDLTPITLGGDAVRLPPDQVDDN